MADDDELMDEQDEGFEGDTDDEPELPDELDVDELDEDAIDEDVIDDDPIDEDVIIGDDDESFEDADDDEAEDDTAGPVRRSTPTEDEDDDDDLTTPDDVEADLDTILKDRLVAADEEGDEEEDEPEDRVDGADRLQPKRADEELCPSCFLLVRRSAPMCPVGDDDCPMFSR